MLHLIYIGRYEKTIKRFSKLPKEEFYNVATCDKAIKIIHRQISKILSLCGKSIPVSIWY